MKDIYPKFNIGQWQYEFAANYGAYCSLQELLGDITAVKFHFAKKSLFSFHDEDYEFISKESVNGELQNKINEEDEKQRDLLLNANYEQLVEANDTYRRQMVVCVVTYVEGVIKDFFKCLFFYHPSRMYKFISSGSDTGKVDLKEVVNTESKNHLLVTLAVKASSMITQGKFVTTIKNLEKVSKVQIDEILISQLTKMVERRNRIVHEASKEQISDQQVRDSFEALYGLLRFLGMAAQHNKVPYSDQAGLLGENDAT